MNAREYVQNSIVSAYEKMKIKLEGVSATREVFNKLTSRIEKFLSDRRKRMIVLYGLRGSGKTTLLWQVYNWLIKRGIPSTSILSFSADDAYSIGFGIREIVSHFIKNTPKPAFVLIDEAQEAVNWDRELKLIHDDSPNGIFILVTGSSNLSFLMSGQTSRRAEMVELGPLTFREYLSIKEGIQLAPIEVLRTIWDNDMKRITSVMGKIESEVGKPLPKLYEEYIKIGALPAGVFSDDPIERYKDIIDKVVYMDLPKIKGFRKETYSAVERIISYLAIQKPGEINYESISKHISLGGFRSPSRPTVETIFDLLEKSGIIFHIVPYSKEESTVPATKFWKYYFVHPSLLWSVRTRFFKSGTGGNVLETAIASSIKLGKFFGRLWFDRMKGADFIAETKYGELAIEVGSSKRSCEQVEITSNRYGIEKRICVTLDPMPRMEHDILVVPAPFFSLME